MPSLIPIELFLLLVFMAKAQSRESKYMVDFERFEQCTEYPNLESPMKNQKFLKINRTARAFSFETDLKRPMDENVGLQVELDKWASNSWIKVPFLPLKPDACNIFGKLLGKLWVDLKRNMGVKQPEKCPIAPGHYGLKDYIYDTSDLGFLVPFKGKMRYKAILRDMKTEDVVQCIRIVINVKEN